MMTIKEMRSLLGLKQAEFGEKYNIPKRTIEDWERGVRTPPQYVLELLARCVMEDAKKITEERSENVNTRGEENRSENSEQKTEQKRKKHKVR